MELIYGYDNIMIYNDELYVFNLTPGPYAKAPCAYPVSDMEDMYKIWGVLICYAVDGQQEVRRQDMTYDINKEGFYQTICPIPKTVLLTIYNYSILMLQKTHPLIPKNPVHSLTRDNNLRKHE